ncbi:MAG: hypothetical protein IKZ49_02765 [Alphaproteobacteria bacterium]|nr:hypothetical protein [Alphaproteobacteria bacterium]
MSLIKCPECNKMVSNTANECPKCGYDFQVKRDLNSFLIYLLFWSIPGILVILMMLFS